MVGAGPHLAQALCDVHLCVSSSSCWKKVTGSLHAAATTQFGQ